jgi:hypothetical protein
MSKLSTKMRQEAKLRQQGIDREVYRAQRIVARIVLAHECNLMPPNRSAADGNLRDETRPAEETETAKSAEDSASMNFSVPLDRQVARSSDQTYVVGGTEESRQEGLKLGRNPPRKESGE